MRTRTTLTGAVGAVAALSASAVVAAAPAQAAPIMQIPAVGVQVSGLVVPGPLVVRVHAAPAAGEWETEFSAPADPAVCSSSAAGMLVRIDYVNPGAMRTGSAVVKPCPWFINPTPTHVKKDTGPGQVFVTAVIIGSPERPDAGQPSLPGVGTFRR